MLTREAACWPMPWYAIWSPEARYFRTGSSTGSGTARRELARTAPRITVTHEDAERDEQQDSDSNEIRITLIAM